MWISQPKWEEQRRLEAEASGRMFAFRLDDSEKKSKIVLCSPALVTRVQRMVPQRLFESTSYSVAIEEPFAPLLHFVDDMRKDMISHHACAKDLEDIAALEYFLYEHQPQYKSARDALKTGRTAQVSFETLWALFMVSDLIVVTDKFEERDYSSSHILNLMRNLIVLANDGVPASSCQFTGGALAGTGNRNAFLRGIASFTLNAFWATVM